MMARPTQSVEGIDSRSEEVVWRNSYWIAAEAGRAVKTSSIAANAGKFFFINNLSFAEYNLLTRKYDFRGGALGQPMLIRKFFALALCAVALAVPAVAKTNPDSLDEVIKKVQQRAARTDTLQADFRQEKELALLSKPEVSTGRSSLSKPNNVSGPTTPRSGCTMLIAEGMLTTYYPDLNKAERIDVKRYQDRIFKYMGASGAIDELGALLRLHLHDNAAKSVRTCSISIRRIETIAKRVRHIKICRSTRRRYLTTQDRVHRGRRRHDALRVHEHEDQPADRAEPVHPARCRRNVRVEQMKLQ